MQQLIKLTIFGFRLAPVLLVVYWIFLFTGTHLPGSAIKSMHFSDKVMHFSAFAGLAFLLAWSLPRQIGRFPGLLVAASITLTYAVIDEYTQGFVPNRTPDVQDFVADALGMLFGFAAYLTLRWMIVGSQRATVSKRPRRMELERSTSQ